MTPTTEDNTMKRNVMLKNTILQFALFLVILGTPSLSSAITMDTTTNGDQVTVTLEAVCSAIIPCSGYFTVTFGDGATATSSAISIPVAENKIWSSSHSYGGVGNYNVTGTWVVTTTPVVAPNSRTEAVSVSMMTVEPSTLKDAAVAEAYQVRFTLTNGTSPFSFRVVSGSLPPGLTLHPSGSLRGIPSRLGRYHFTILFGDGKGGKFTRQYELIVNSGDVTIRSADGGNFRVTKMRIYFDNNRPRKVISRSSKDSKASVEINYTGTGLLKGYWEVDGRILQRVQKNVRFGKSLVLETPSVPPLPTYAEGTHRLRFVISVPEQPIKLPTAYYDVVEKGKSARTVIVLLTPSDEKSISLTGTIFSWQASKGVTNYRISFFDKESNEGKPLFTVYTKELAYQLPSQAAEKFFHSGTTYTWLIIGLDKDGKSISESQSREFSSLP